MFSLGCSCGRAESQTPLSRRQTDCFSYVVSVDGIHVCYRQNIIEYESIEEERELESDSQTLVKYESTREDEIESNPQTLVEDESTEGVIPERKGPCSLLQRRGISLSGIDLAFSTATRSPVHLSGHLSGETNIVDHPHFESGKYELVKQIGVDGEGVIHLMRCRSTKELIARKTVSYARSAHAKPIEAAILQDLLPERHENIIRLHAFEPYQAFDSEQMDGARYYVEYCSGGDLHQLVDQYKKHEVLLPEPFIFQAYQQLASALEFLHRGFDPRRSDPDRRGICHRDIKPSNIFLRFTRDSAYPDVVLADFGHATLDFATYDPAGTALWQGPELPRHSPKGDVYSLGAVIHFLIHFKAPIAKLPDGVPNTERMRAAWASWPPARKPVIGFVDGYSEELVCAMLVPLEADEKKRKNSSQLLKFVSECIELKFPPGADLRWGAEEWPMAEWAFDHMETPDGIFGEEDEEEEEEEETGAEQYFQMMEIFGGGIVTRETSQSSSLSDGRWGAAGRSSRGWETSTVATSVGEMD